MRGHAGCLKFDDLYFYSRKTRELRPQTSTRLMELFWQQDPYLVKNHTLSDIFNLCKSNKIMSKFLDAYQMIKRRPGYREWQG